MILSLFDTDEAPFEAGGKDDFQTPPYALDPILPLLDPGWLIWEPACGEGNLAIRLCKQGFECIGTDIKVGWDFLTTQPPWHFDCVVTNPPYSIKDAWIERCYEIGKPFALLMPVKSLGEQKRQEMYRQYGIDVIMLGRRINFTTPTGKTDGDGSSANFESAWFTWKLPVERLGRPVNRLVFTTLK